MIYLKVPSVTSPATLTNKRSHAARGLVDNLILKNMKEENCPV